MPKMYTSFAYYFFSKMIHTYFIIWANWNATATAITAFS